MPSRKRGRQARRALSGWRQDELLDAGNANTADVVVPAPIYHARLRDRPQRRQVRRVQALRFRRAAELFLAVLALIAGVLVLTRLFSALEAPLPDMGRVVNLLDRGNDRAEANAPTLAGNAAFVEDPFIQPVESPPITAASAMIVDLGQRTILFGRDIHEPHAPASLAKLATAVVALERARADTRIQVPPTAAEQPPNIIGLVPGEVLTLQDLLFAMLLPSANDAAVAIADGIGGEAYTVAQMNDLARRLGLSHTRFANAVGFDAPDHESTAFELAVLAADAIERFPLIARVVATRAYVIPAGPANSTYTATSLNGLLWTYDGALGVKTGRTEDAGANIIAAAERDGRRLMVVVLGSSQRERDAAVLLDFGFQLLNAQG